MIRPTPGQGPTLLVSFVSEVISWPQVTGSTALAFLAFAVAVVVAMLRTSNETTQAKASLPV